MKVPLSWLKEFIELTNIPSAKVGKALTLSGLELDALLTIDPPFRLVVVGEIVDVQEHPNADQLKLATVTDGVKKYQVVCGAQNCRVGIRSAFAPIGAELTDETGKSFKIKPAKLRGVASEGMLCSGKELGISDEWDGIVEFSDHIAVGSDINSLYSEELFEISLTPNLAHCASIIGVARELSAALSLPLSFKEIAFEEEGPSIDTLAKVNVQDTQRCPRYAARVITGLTVGTSPEWMQKQLLAAGVRPINNIVDITNYVLMETGQPLHAFDLSLVEGQEIDVRTANQGERFVTLDGKEYELSGEDLLICDQKRPIALAGVMGGKNSEVNTQTTEILLESAYFDPVTIRRTSKRHGIISESSKRFERGTDPNAVTQALDRAAELYVKYASGKVAKGIIDVKEQEFLPKKVNVRLSRINHLLGTQLSLSEVESFFQRLQFLFHWDGKDRFTVTVPTYRVDIHQEIDLVEEVARIFGFENLPKSAVRMQVSQLPHAPIYLFEKELRTQLLALGLTELLTCDLIGNTLLDIVKDTVLPKESRVEVVNPTSIEQSILRTSLLPGLLQVVKYNIDHNNHDISGFEVGRIHFKEGDEYRERSQAGIILTGSTKPFHFDQKRTEVDFFDLKGILETLFDELSDLKPHFRPGNLNLFHPGRQASIELDGRLIGRFGEVHPSIRRKLGVKQRIYFAEFDLHELLLHKKESVQYTPLPVYPGSDRDWTVPVKEEIPMGLLFQWIDEAGSEYLEKRELIDIYRGEGVDKGVKNVTLRFFYRDQKKTIKQKRVDQEHEKIVNYVQDKLGVGE